jgi:hypothetical protein
MQPRFKSVMNGQGVKHTRFPGKVASEFSADIIFSPYTAKTLYNDAESFIVLQLASVNHVQL